MSGFFDKFRDNTSKITQFLEWLAKFIVAIGIVYYFIYLSPTHRNNPILKEYSDGVQNHLIWNIKGECFFVRPNDDVTVYLIRVQDCDKK